MLAQLSEDARVTLEITQDPVTNVSRLRLTKLEVRQRDGTYVGACWLIGEIRISGKTAATLQLSSILSCDVAYCDTWNGGGESDWPGYSCQTVEIAHRADGSMEVDVNIALQIYTTSQKFVENFSRSATISLPRVPRATQLAAEGVELGQRMTIRLTRAVDSFRDTVRWSCGSESGTLADATEETELTWVPPVSLAAQETQAESVRVELTAETFAGEEAVGTSTITLPCPIPASVAPEVTLTVSDRMGYAGQHGGYIRNRSQAAVKADCTEAYGAAIQQVRLTCGDLTADGSTAAFTLPRSGRVEITAQVTDSRGRTASDSCTITVLTYDPPRAQILSAFRCNAAGEAQADGDHLCLRFRGEATEIENSRTTYRVNCRVHGGSAVTELPLEEFNDAFLAEGTVIVGADVDSAYDCTFFAQDSFAETQSAIAPVGVAFALVDFCRGSRGIGIGMRAKLERMICVGLDMDMQENRISNLAEPRSPGDGATKAYVDEKFKELAAKIAAIVEGEEQ